MQHITTLSILFAVITIATMLWFYRATNSSKLFLVISITWLCTQGIIAMTGFYGHEFSLPPRFILLLLPPVLTVATLFASKNSRQWLDKADLKQLTLLHSLRIVVEIGLYLLFLQKTIPEAMTFAGRNFDVIAGLSAPFVYYIIFVKGRFSRRLLLGWNIISLLLLLNIIIVAVLSLKTPFQRFGFDQPNIALTMFPFIWLPCFVVPLVLLAHLIAIRTLWNKK